MNRIHAGIREVTDRCRPLTPFTLHSVIVRITRRMTCEARRLRRLRQVHPVVSGALFLVEPFDGLADSVRGVDNPEAHALD